MRERRQIVETDDWAVRGVWLEPTDDSYFPQAENEVRTYYAEFVVPDQRVLNEDGSAETRQGYTFGTYLHLYSIRSQRIQLVWAPWLPDDWSPDPDYGGNV